MESPLARFVIDLSGQIRCAMCKAVKSYGSIQPLRDQAHLGRPSAQFEFATEVRIDGYPRDAMIWWEKAAAQGHPRAFICLAESSRNGLFCKRELALARMYAERAKELHAAYAPVANAELATIAQVYLDEGSVSVASDIVNSLLRHQYHDKTNPVGEVPIDYVCCERLVPLLVQLEHCEEQIRMVQARSIKLQIHHRIVSPVEYAMDAADVGALAVANFFLQCIVSKEDYEDENSWTETKERRLEIRRSLRELRRRCSGCGTSLRGCPKKICNGCRAHSYCDRACQKKHWNKPKDGHRDECLGVQCFRGLFGVEWKL